MRPFLPSPRPTHHGPDIEARAFRGSLSRSEWTTRGGRNHIFLLASGAGEAMIGEARAALAQPCLVFVPSGWRGTVRFEAGADGRWLTLSEAALGRAMPVGPVFAEVRKAIALPILGLRMEREALKGMIVTLDAIHREIETDTPGSREAVRHHLALLLIAIWRITNPADLQPKPSPRAIVHDFLHLVELHARDHWTVARYARFLGVGTDRLNSAVRRATGRSPLAHIHARLMAQAETLLDGSPLQIGEIAHALGFRDAAYFSRFFKRITGHPPRIRRDDAVRRSAKPDTSFAAWP